MYYSPGGEGNAPVVAFRRIIFIRPRANPKKGGVGSAPRLRVRNGPQKQYRKKNEPIKEAQFVLFYCYFL